MAKVKLTDRALKDNPLGEVILQIRGLARHLSSASKRLESCFVTSLDTSEPIVDPFLARTVVSHLESDPAIVQVTNSGALPQLKEYIAGECQRAANSFETRLRSFCQKNNIPLEGRFPRYLLSGFLQVSVEDAKGICRVGRQSTKSLMLESIAPTILGTLSNEAARSFDEASFLEELYEAYERVIRLKGMSTGQPAPILDVFHELVFIKQPPAFGKNPVQSNFQDYTKESFARDLARVSATTTTSGGKRLELTPTAFPHEDGLLMRIDGGTRYAGRLAFW